MSDALLPWASDLAAGASGDIALTSGSSLTQQRVLRRLLTNRGCYVWQPGYGASLGQYLGTPSNEREIAGSVKSQMLHEVAISTQPEPTIMAQAFASGTLFVEIQYVDAPTGGTELLTFTVSS
jgi:phage baseplate assembly protein W